MVKTYSAYTTNQKTWTIDDPVKSLEIVMPDLIRHPEYIEITEFRRTPDRSPGQALNRELV